jgi:Reverse transcriptase (RNA-dependent DNA polymerase)
LETPSIRRKNAFLEGTLEEEIYMKLRPGHEKETQPNLACRLNKSIYGLKQSSRVWYKKLSSFLISCDFKVSNADHSLFSKISCNLTIIVLIYVDDIIIMGDNL